MNHIPLIIISAVVLFIVFILSIRVKVCITGNDTFAATLKILFLRFRLYPRPVTPKKAIKDAKKEKKKKKEKKVSQAATPTKHKNKKHPLQIVKLILHMLKKLYSRFPKYLKLRVNRFVISVGGEDAAHAAIYYGGVRAASSYLFTAAETMFTVKTPRNAELVIEPNFLNSKTTCDIQLVASISVFSALRLALRALSAFLSGKKYVSAPKNVLPSTEELQNSET